MSQQYDVIVIGTGPGGYVAAIRAAQLGLKTAVVEKDKDFGGTCLLRGCIPTKSMLESAALADHARHASEFGVQLGEVSIDLPNVLKRKNKVVRQNAGGVAYLLKKNKIETLHGFGRLLGGGRVSVDDGQKKLEVSARNIILATGSDPRHIPGFDIDEERILSSNGMLELSEMPDHLLVLGAGAVGVEFASVFRSFGCKVTLIELMDRVVPLEDEEVSVEFAKIFQRRGIDVHTGTRCTELVRDGKTIRAVLTAEGKKPSRISASHCLVAIGRKPLTENIGLENTRAVVDRGFVVTDEFQRTGEPGVYAIGDIVANSPLLAHAASAEGILAAEHIAGASTEPLDYRQVPNCTYSNPEVGSLGLTERAARDAGYELRVGQFPFTAVGKAKVINDTSGFVKIVSDAQYGEILGVHIIGPHATDLIAEVGPLLKLECTVEELARTIHAHPTLSEAIVEAAHATLGHAIHM